MKTTLKLIYLVIVAFVATARAQSDAPASDGGAAPPSAAPQLSEADLEKLVGPIALYPDPLLATLLPASAYPLDIVKAARFIANTNNIPKIDSQPWDPNVKALARFPEVIQKMNDDLDWTSSLGDAFANDQKSVMNAIQVMRGKAEQSGTLKTSPQQVVTVTNTIVEKTVNEQVTLVTNTVVQIVPASPDVIYVPTYNPAYVYYGPPPGAVAAASFVSFGMGMAMGAAFANNCDWHGGGVYHHGDVDINRNVNVNRNVNNNFNRSGGNRTVNNNNFNNASANRSVNNSSFNNSSGNRNARQNTSGNTSGQQKWQPDPSRREARKSTSPASSGWSGANSSGQRGAFDSSGGAAQTRNASQRGTTSRTGGQSSGTGQRSTGTRSAGQRSGGQRLGGQSGGGGRRSGGGGRRR